MQRQFSAKAIATDVAKQLGTAMLSVVSSFGLWGSSTETPPRKGSKQASSDVGGAAGAVGSAAKERATALHYEYELDDPRRHIYSMEVRDGLMMCVVRLLS